MVKAAYRTKQQDLLLSFLKQTKGAHFTAEDVRNHFLQKQITIGMATIYRQLEKFVADGSVLKYYIDEQSAACFEYTGESKPVVESGDFGGHFHIKCEKCGVLIHLDCEELVHLQEHLEANHGISINLFRTVFYGLCANCRKKENQNEQH